MDIRMEIRCPNCGSLAQRLLSDCLPTGRKCPARQVTQTECPVCDYFMVMCGQNGRVLEAYAPGRQGLSFTTALLPNAVNLDRQPQQKRSPDPTLGPIELLIG